MSTALATLASAVLLDRFLGEYPNPIHPVVWIGNTVSLLLKIAPKKGWWRQFGFGVFLAVGVPAFSCAAVMIAMHMAAAVPLLGFYLGMILGMLLLKSSFALHELGAAAERVSAPVLAGDLPRAREALRSLCSRDPALLDEEGLLAATIQSLAENASDSFVAPLFYYVLFGVPGAIAYRAVNTLDAMVGYRGSFEALGKASARLDDLLNWVPARLTAMLLLIAGWVTGKNAARGWRICLRDGAKTPSPNGGRPMAMMAGLLGVQLEKKGFYTVGDPENALVPVTVTQAWRLVVLAGWLAAGLCALGIVGVHR